MLVSVSSYASDPSEAFLFLGLLAKQGLMTCLLSYVWSQQERPRNQ
jgi:hypothetical protein